MTSLLVALDVLFAVFHSTFVLFVVVGWAWQRTRQIHLIAATLTLASWFGLGLFFGWGYCPCTDWHWDIKRALGETDLPRSYIKYYTDRLTGVAWDPALVNEVVVLFGVVAFALSVALNVRDRRRERSRADGVPRGQA